MQSERLLILSDEKPGHLNQSIAFAKHLGYEYDICRVAFKNRLAKAASYLADRLGLQLPALFESEEVSGEYRAVVSAGSETYYTNRVLASQLGCKSVAIMLPQGYRYDFDLIVAQEHDDPPELENIITLPINLSYVEPKGSVVSEPNRKYIAVIIGGDSKQAKLDPDQLREQIDKIFSLFPTYDFWLTTSRRTSVAVEKVLREFDFSWAVYFSQEQINPIPDYLAQSDYVFLTADSTSMVSEAVSFGPACIEVLPFKDGSFGQGKSFRMLTGLKEAGALHFFDQTVSRANHKIDLTQFLGGVIL